MNVAVLGANGFVGSAFVRFLAARNEVALTAVTRANYAEHAGRRFDVVVDASCNSRKYLAEQQPVAEFELSVVHRLRTLHDFPAGLQVHLSSVDVYSDLSSPATTHEDAPIDLAAVSHYGMHKILAENLVRHYASRWLIVRLAGMVGESLRKNPVFDIVTNQSIRIHPDSAYQFMHTAEVARIVWHLVEGGHAGDVWNVCGRELITPRAIAEMAGLPLNTSLTPPDAGPRIVAVDIAKIEKIVAIPPTAEALCRFLAERRGAENVVW